MTLEQSASGLGLRLRRAGLVLSVFLCIWGVALVAIDRYGSDLPYWDQWGKEGEMLFQPWFERHEFWRNLLIPHNEHRMAPTLVLSFGLLRAGGDQWDARVQCVASAALHALLIAGIVAWASRRLAPRWTVTTAIVGVMIAAPPIVTENVLGGFQTQFYFLEIFSVLALAALLGRPAGSWPWLVGVIGTALASVSMGSGFLVAVPLAIIAGWRFAVGRGRRDAAVTLAVAITAVVVGIWFRPQAPWHAPLHAHSALEFLVYAARCLSWPLYGAPWLAPLMWLPSLVLAGSRLRRWARNDASTTDAEFVLAGGAWVLAQVAAVTYSRGGGSAFPAVRYGDVSALGLFFNFLALGILARGGRARVVAGAAIGWIAVVAVMMTLATNDAVHGNLASKRRENLEYEKNVRAFVLTDDYAAFSKQELPFPSPEWLARILHRDSIRRLLPASVREPLHVTGWAGPAAPAPVLTNRATRTISAPGEWKSPLLPPGHGWWKFETAGDVGPGAGVAALVSERTGRVLALVAPTKPAGNSWRAAYVRAPTEPALVVIKAASPGSWVALSEPVEMSSLSYWTWRVASRGAWIAGLGMLGLVALSLAVFRPKAG